MVTVTRQELESILDEVIEIILRKNADYGDAWQRHGVAGVLVRLSDKSLRLQNLEGREALVVDESVTDTLIDIVGYAALGLLHQRSRFDRKE